MRKKFCVKLILKAELRGTGYSIVKKGLINIRSMIAISVSRIQA
jgi:hypothetical protein